MKNTYEEYHNHLKKLADINHSIAVLSWDKEVHLPKDGANFRSRQVATLSALAHEQFTKPKFGELLQNLSEKKGLNSKQSKNIRLSLKEYVKATKFSEEFVIKRSKLVSAAFHSWIKARDENNFDLYAEDLGRLIEIKKEEAEIIGYKSHPYDALLDQYEPGMTCSELDALFSNIKPQLIDLIKRINQKDQVSDEFLRTKFDKDEQWEFGLELLRQMGYNFDAGRQDISTHPFTISFSPQDVRVTTRIDENDFSNMTWSCIHEGGHALYEQGLPIEEYGLPTGNAISLGIHESQSRLWENQVGRSKNYWTANYPSLKKRFPQLSSVSLDNFYKAINKIGPGFIRTEADELHYHFHVMIRYEIEKRIFEGSLSVEEIKNTWNDLYEEYLGIRPTSDIKGVLQDVHWAHGGFGYFATYSLGSFYGAQFYAKAEEQITGLNDQIRSGDLTLVKSWLSENVYIHGRLYEAQELCERISGEKLNVSYFMNYAKEKFGAIYGL